MKGESFTLDSNIPIQYFFSFFMCRLIELVYAIFFFKTMKTSYLSLSACIKCSSKISFVKNLSIGRNVYIDALSIEGIKLGRNVSIGKYTTIECSGTLQSLGKGLIIGDNVGLGTHGFWGCAGGIEIGNDVIFGNYVSLHSENHNYHNLSIPIRLQGVNRRGIKIGQNCWIGAKVTILDGVIIGNGCIIAAGSVVVAGKYQDNAIYAGVPAKFIKMRG